MVLVPLIRHPSTWYSSRQRLGSYWRRERPSRWAQIRTTFRGRTLRGQSLASGGRKSISRVPWFAQQLYDWWRYWIWWRSLHIHWITCMPRGNRWRRRLEQVAHWTAELQRIHRLHGYWCIDFHQMGMGKVERELTALTLEVDPRRLPIPSYKEAPDRLIFWE